jgi:hypothetical protein
MELSYLYKVIPLLGWPLLVMIPGVLILRYSKKSALDEPFDIDFIWYRLRSFQFTPRRFAQVALLVLPILNLDSLGLPGVNLLWYTFWAIVIGRILVENPRLPRDTHEVLENLEATTSTIGAVRSNLEHLIAKLSTAAADLATKEQQRAEIEGTISRLSKESEAFKTLTDQQKQLVAESFQVSFKKSPVGVMGVVLGSVVLNLLATLIWTLMGNPGKDEIKAWLSSLAGGIPGG